MRPGLFLLAAALALLFLGDQVVGSQQMLGTIIWLAGIGCGLWFLLDLFRTLEGIWTRGRR